MKSQTFFIFGFFLLVFTLSFISSSYSNCEIYGNCNPISVISTGSGETINNNYYNVTQNITNNITQSPSLNEWINTSKTLYQTTNLIPTYLTTLNTTLLPNSWYNFKCEITYASNITTNGIRLGARLGSNPISIITSMKIPQGNAGTDSFMEHQGSVNYYNVTSTGTVSTALNYSAVMEGSIVTSGVNNYWIPYFASENSTRMTNVTRAYCRWTKLE